MLVSSIGYFNVDKVSVIDNGIKNQANRKSSTEKFGQVDVQSSVFSIACEQKNFANFIKSLLGLQKDESKSYLDMIG